MNYILKTLMLSLVLSVGALGQSDVAPTAAPEIQAVSKSIETARITPEQSAPNVPASVGRPILYVHGCGGSDVGWQAMLESISASVRQSRPDLYSENSAYGAIFDGANVYFYD